MIGPVEREFDPPSRVPETPPPGQRGTAAAPATVGNLNCGFDVFGLALESPVDRVTARVVDAEGVRISALTGATAGVPMDADLNSASVAAKALLRAHRRSDGIELELNKELPLAAGLGGSAAGAAAAVVAVDQLLALRSSPETLLTAGLEGERVASGSTAADNVAAALMGGIVLVRTRARRKLVSLPILDAMTVALLRPHLEVSTRSERAALPRAIPLADAAAQWGDTAALAAALHTGDWDLLADALVDRVAEPHRAMNVPAFQAVRTAALTAGAVGCGLSGSGPTIFALCRGRDTADGAARAMKAAFVEAGELGASIHVSAVARDGAIRSNG